MKLLLPILTLLATGAIAPAAPFFPDFTQDSVSIKGSPLIGAPITSPGRYLFALEDLNCAIWCDYDYNDVYGELTWFGPELGIIQFTVQGGIGLYWNAGTAGFAGTLPTVTDELVLIFNTPTGPMYSGTDQVLIYKIDDLPSGSPIPEPMTLSMVGLALLGLGWTRRVSKCSPQ
jgi:hypothetical protein